MKFRFLIFSLYFSIIPADFSANDQNGVLNDIYIDSKVHYGFIIPHHESIAYLLEKHVKGFELNISRQTYGNHIWEQLYRYPRTGLGYFFCDYGNPEMLGMVHALFGYMNIPIVKNQNNYHLLNYQISFGISYLTKRFDVYENPLNTAIGSHLNIYFRLGFDTKIPVSEKIEILGEVGFTHCSNGKIKSPNYGLNVLSGSLGLNYFLNNTNKERIKSETPDNYKRNYFSFIYSAGIKVYDNLYDTKYFISSLSFDYERHLNMKRRIGFGADLFYDKSISEALAVDWQLDRDMANLIRFGLHGSHTLIYNKLLMTVNIGRYLYSKYTDLSLFYSRLALRYKLTSHILLNLSLKAHSAKADFIEWGMGYYW
jgi:hypothetical protein